MMQPKMVVGVFDDHADAVGALQELKDAGFDPNQVSVAMLQAPRPEGEVPQGAHFDERTGILAGGVLGGLTGWLIGATAVACLLYTSPSPRDRQKSRMPSSA